MSILGNPEPRDREVRWTLTSHGAGVRGLKAANDHRLAKGQKYKGPGLGVIIQWDTHRALTRVFLQPGLETEILLKGPGQVSSLLYGLSMLWLLIKHKRAG